MDIADLSAIIKHCLWADFALPLTAEIAIGISAVHDLIGSQLQRDNVYNHLSVKYEAHKSPGLTC